MVEIDNCKLYNGNCLELMKDIPEKSIDMVLCDLPYGSTPLTWDKPLSIKKLWDFYNKIIKTNGCIALFGQEPFSSFVRLSNLDMFRYDWYWQKERLTNIFQIKTRPGKVIETISIFYQSNPTYNPQKLVHNGKKVTNKIGETAKFSYTQVGKSNLKPLEYNDDGTRYPIQVLKINHDNLREILHPTQKPVALLEYLIKTYTNENMVVLDNCMGSGSTGIACINTNRKFVGIELNKEYFNIACERIYNATRQLKLF